MNKTTLNKVTKLNRFKQVDANSLSELRSCSFDVKLLPSSANYDWFASQKDVGDLVCNGEVITLGKARYANIKYYKGKFLSSNNILIESINENKIRTKYLYYFLLKTKKDYYVEGTTYPKFDQHNFDTKEIPLHNIEKQENIISQLDSLISVIDNKNNEIKKLDDLVKSRFIRQETFIWKKV